MKISAQISNSFRNNDVHVSTDGNIKKVEIPSKNEGYGSFLNGGELLLLSLAVCFCNDLYREANRRNCEIYNVDVRVFGEFAEEGMPAQNITYEVLVEAPDLTQEEISSLIEKVDEVAEVHKTLRNGIEIKLR